MPSVSLQELIEARFSEGMGTITDLGIQIKCEDGKVKHMSLPYRQDLCVSKGKGLPSNLAATLLDTAFGLDAMLFANVMKYTATIDFSTVIVNEPKPNNGLIAFTEVIGTHGNSVIMRGEVEEIETGEVVMIGQGNFVLNQVERTEKLL